MRLDRPINRRRDSKGRPGRRRALTPRLTTLEGRVLLSTTIGVNITGTTSDIANYLHGDLVNPPDTMRRRRPGSLRRVPQRGLRRLRQGDRGPRGEDVGCGLLDR